EAMPRGFGAADFNSGLNKDALIRCRWIGAPKPEIDPLKERKADALALENSMTTLEEVAARRGTDWRDLIDQQAREEAYAKSKGVVLNYGYKPDDGEDDDEDEARPRKPTPPDGDTNANQTKPRMRVAAGA